MTFSVCSMRRAMAQSGPITAGLLLAIGGKGVCQQPDRLLFETNGKPRLEPRKIFTKRLDHLLAEGEPTTRLDG